MPSVGFAFLVVAFAASVAAAICLLAGYVGRNRMASKIGRIAVLASACSLLVCCGVLVVCFMVGDVSIQYVLEERSLSTDGFAWLYKLSGSGLADPVRSCSGRSSLRCSMRLCSPVHRSAIALHV